MLADGSFPSIAIAFTLVQVGMDVPARKFLQTVLDADPSLKDHVDVVMEGNTNLQALTYALLMPTLSDEDLEATFPDTRNPKQDRDFIVSPIVLSVF